MGDPSSVCYSRPSVLALVTAVTLLVATALAGCTSGIRLPGTGTADYRERALSRSDGGLRVTTSVLSANESIDVYGVPLATRGIQPVWVEVENGEDIAYWLLSPGLDPDFFPASEAAEAFARNDEPKDLQTRFTRLAFRNPVPAGSTVSGFVLTNRDEGVKMVHVDLVNGQDLKSFSTLHEVPGFLADYHGRSFVDGDLYAPESFTDFTDQAELRAALEALPCCVSNRRGTRFGDPLNLVIIGGIDDAFAALVRRGWRPTERTWWGSVTRMINSTLAGERYPYAPVSPLYFFGRRQDLALQKARDNIHQRNHLRLWLSPMRYHGKPVWVGQISRDIGSRLTIHSPYLTTHKIDPDVDEARAALTEDLAYSQNLAALGLVSGVGAATRDAPRENLTTDPYYTDGFRVVLVFDTRTTSLDEIDFLPWEQPVGGFLDPGRQPQSR